MKLLYSLVLTVLFSFLFFTIRVEALTAELVSEQDNVKVYNILAEPPQDSSAVQFRVNVSGGTIIDVNDGDKEKLSYLAICENNKPFFEQNICLDIASIGGLIENEQVLIKVTVESIPGEEIVFSSNPDHAYLTTSRDLITENGAIINSFPLTSIEERPAPIIEDAAVNESNSLPYVLLLGILIILVGAFLVIIFMSGKESKSQV